MDGKSSIPAGLQPAINMRGKVSIGENAPLSSPISIMRTIYSSNDPKELKDVFDNHCQYAKNNPDIYAKVLEDIYSHNDRVNISELKSGDRVDKMKLAIRAMARCIFRLGEIKGGAKILIGIYDRMKDLKSDWRASKYFGSEYFNAIAKSDPGIILEMLNSGGVDDQEAAALSLLRKGCNLSQERIGSIISSSGNPDRVSLVHYIDDPKFKLEVLEKELNDLNEGYYEKCWREREIVSALASFPEGRDKLEVLRASGRINIINIGGIYFGTFAGSGSSAEDLQRSRERMSVCADLIKKANEKFGGREKIFYVDITPDKDEKGEPMNGAGWGDNCLYLTISTLKDNSDRALSFSLLHEACERQFSHGKFSSELGMTYISALELNGPDSIIETFRLGRRIGGEYVESDLGHPRDSEREWLAETASAAIIGESLPNKAMPALSAVFKLFQ